MSRTYKDRPSKVNFPDWFREDTHVGVSYTRTGRNYRTGEYGEWPSICLLKVAGVLTKKRKECDFEWHWLQSTPSWWTRCMMNRPQRRRSRVWEHEVVKYHIYDDTLEPPLLGRKPHLYYY